MAITTEFEKLRSKYDLLLVEWTRLQGNLEAYSKKADKAKTELLAFAKVGSLDEILPLLDRLSKEIETRIEMLRDKINNLERLISDVRSAVDKLDDNSLDSLD